LREILRLDDRGRLLIPKSAREFLDLEEKLEGLKKSTDTIQVVAILSTRDRILRLTSISAGKGDDSLTVLVRSEDVPESHKEIVSEFGESMWGLTTTIVEGAIKDGDDVVPLEINKSGRIHTSKVIRNMLDLTPESYLITVPSGREDGVKELQIVPLLDPQETFGVRIMRSDGVEWRLIFPIPEDPESLRNKLQKEKDVEKVDFFLI
jgi:bifunctional DNA-binding transcriptional regulator/antitoxin component of YhaV-PrlF toxin-antitoxin module